MSSCFEWDPSEGVRRTRGFGFLFGFIAAGQGGVGGGRGS